MPIYVDRCALCNHKITPETPFLSTAPKPDDMPADLYPYCETAMHQHCISDWSRRIEFATAYQRFRSGGLLLKESEEYSLYCGPLVYGPGGKVDLPYYAEVRPSEWPIRLYARFEDWGNYISKRPWVSDFIPALSEYVENLLPAIPSSVEELKQFLLPPILRGITEYDEYRSRYISVLALDLFDDVAERAVSTLQAAMNDEHDSVRQAARIRLKRWGLLQ